MFCSLLHQERSQAQMISALAKKFLFLLGNQWELALHPRCVEQETRQHSTSEKQVSQEFFQRRIENCLEYFTVHMQSQDPKKGFSWRNILIGISMRKKHQVHLQSPSCHLEFCIIFHLPCLSIFITLFSLSPKDNSCLFPFAQTSFSVPIYSKFRSPFPLGRHFSSLVYMELQVHEGT